MNGKHIKCKKCFGHGLVLDMNGEPNDCFTCFGSGYNWFPPKDLTETITAYHIKDDQYKTL